MGFALKKCFMASPNSTTNSLRKIERAAWSSFRPDFFATLGIRMLDGRTFTADELRSGNVFVISQAAAQRFWPDGDAVGAEIKWGRNWGTVVGVADDVASGGMIRGKDDPLFYMPFKAEEVPTNFGAPPSMQ